MRTNCQPVVTAWEVHLASLVTPPEPNLDDPLALCRDDRCPRLSPHVAHVILDADEDRTVYDDTGLDSVVFRHVTEREVRTAGQIYTAVCNDYGYIHYRTVQDCLTTLATRRQVILVMPSRTRRRIGDPLNLTRGGGAGSLGAWIRYSSPLLFQSDGYEVLAAQVDDLITDRTRAPVRRRHRLEASCP